MVPIKTIQDLISKHSSLEKELSSGQIEKKQYAEKSKEEPLMLEIEMLIKYKISLRKQLTLLSKKNWL